MVAGGLSSKSVRSAGRRGASLLLALGLEACQNSSVGDLYLAERSATELDQAFPAFGAALSEHGEVALISRDPPQVIAVAEGEPRLVPLPLLGVPLGVRIRAGRVEVLFAQDAGVVRAEEPEWVPAHIDCPGVPISVAGAWAGWFVVTERLGEYVVSWVPDGDGGASHAWPLPSVSSPERPAFRINASGNRLVLTQAIASDGTRVFDSVGTLLLSLRGAQRGARDQASRVVAFPPVWIGRVGLQSFVDYVSGDYSVGVYGPDGRLVRVSHLPAPVVFIASSTDEPTVVGFATINTSRLIFYDVVGPRERP